MTQKTMQYIYFLNQIGSEMNSILQEINKVRQKLKRGVADTLLSQKPFAQGMYSFSMFMISYYFRVRESLKIDYEAFMIIQTVVSHNLYIISKKKYTGSSYEGLEIEWENITKKYERTIDAIADIKPKSKNLKLTISSICLVTGIPKETVRRKIK